MHLFFTFLNDVLEEEDKEEFYAVIDGLILEYL